MQSAAGRACWGSVAGVMGSWPVSFPPGRRVCCVCVCVCVFITIICLSGSGEISGLFEAAVDEAWSVACCAQDLGPISNSSNPCLHPAYTLSVILCPSLLS